MSLIFKKIKKAINLVIAPYKIFLSSTRRTTSTTSPYYDPNTNRTTTMFVPVLLHRINWHKIKSNRIRLPVQLYNILLFFFYLQKDKL
jgi:hypothetical protein